MSTVSLTVGVILGGLGLGWAFHRRSTRRLTPILRRMAVETDGVVQSPNPFVMPKLLFSYPGVEVEVSSASTGISGESIRYTYVLFTGLAPRTFEFRILPRSLQTVADEWAGFKKPMAIEVGKITEHLTIYTSDGQLMEAVLTGPIQADLLYWASGTKGNRVSDIRTYDDKLIYAVTDTLRTHDEFKLLVGSACRFLDAVRHVGPSPSRVSERLA